MVGCLAFFHDQEQPNLDQLNTILHAGIKQKTFSLCSLLLCVNAEYYITKMMICRVLQKNSPKIGEFL